MKMKIMALISLLALSFGGTIHAENLTQSVTLQNGDISFVTSTPVFTPVKITNDVGTKTTGSGLTTISDFRGSGSGWSVSFALTDFTMTKRDPSGGTGDVTVSFPASSVLLKFTTPTLSNADAGQAVHPTNGPLGPQSLVAANNTTLVLVAQPGYGMGSYKLPFTMDVTVPPSLMVTAVTGTGGKYKQNDYVGILSGSYTSTLKTYLTAGI